MRIVDGTPERHAGKAATGSTSRDAAAGAQLPERYSHGWIDLFESHIEPRLKPKVRILDVGSGRRPAFMPDQRPNGCEYVGLDLSLSELQRAPAGSYDEIIAADISQPIESLRDRFDLIVSWQVFEHVAPLDVAVANVWSYLLPDGQMVAMLSGLFSLFGVVNKVTPTHFGPWILRHMTGRDPETVFPAYYDRCYYSALVKLFGNWSAVDVLPQYQGASYFRWSRHAQGAYFIYENWAERSGHHNLISARR
jgi:SAM-dependent methyltransferase